MPPLMQVTFVSFVVVLLLLLLLLLLHRFPTHDCWHSCGTRLYCSTIDCKSCMFRGSFSKFWMSRHVCPTPFLFTLHSCANFFYLQLPMVGTITFHRKRMAWSRRL